MQLKLLILPLENVSAAEVELKRVLAFRSGASGAEGIWGGSQRARTV